MKKPANVDSYIKTFPAGVQVILLSVREAIQKTAPETEESISYGMPAYFFLGKPLIYFAGYKNHIGLYATPSGHAAFAKALAKYKQGKGSVQFPIEEPMPLVLIKRIVKFRLSELKAKDAVRKPLVKKQAKKS